MRSYRWHVTYVKGGRTLTARTSGADRASAQRNAAGTLGVSQRAIRSLVRLPHAVTPIAGDPLDSTVEN